MDKKNTIIGVLLIGTAIFMMSRDMKQAREDASAQQAQQQAVESMPDPKQPAQPPADAPARNNGGSLFADAQAETEAANESTGLIEAGSDRPEKTFTLANDFIRVTFTSKGGAVKQVEFIDE